MTEILTPDEVDVLRWAAERTSSNDVAGSFVDDIMAVCDSHEALRTALAEADSKAEAARVIRRVSTAERVAETETLRAELAATQAEIGRLKETIENVRKYLIKRPTEDKPSTLTEAFDEWSRLIATTIRKAFIPTPDETTCGHCGTTPALGFAAIGDTRYCHGNSQDPTCFQLACEIDPKSPYLRQLVEVTRDAG